MDIHEFVALAERVHDGERMSFGKNTSREERNANWEFIVGVAHWGHPKYNSRPDPQWHVKNAGGGRPQSDDVVVSLPSRMFWDCIPSSGTDEYRFGVGGHADPLPEVQEVYAPKKPKGWDGAKPPVTPPEKPPVPPIPPTPTDDLTDVLSALKALVEENRSQSALLREFVDLAKGSDNTVLVAKLALLTDQLAAGFSVKGKAGWPVGNFDASVTLKEPG